MKNLILILFSLVSLESSGQVINVIGKTELCPNDKVTVEYKLGYSTTGCSFSSRTVTVFRKPFGSSGPPCYYAQQSSNAFQPDFYFDFYDDGDYFFSVKEENSSPCGYLISLTYCSGESAYKYSTPPPSPLNSWGEISIFKRQFNILASNNDKFVPGISNLSIAPRPYQYSNGIWYHNGNVEKEFLINQDSSLQVIKGGLYSVKAYDNICGMMTDSFLVNLECNVDSLVTNFGFDDSYKNGYNYSGGVPPYGHKIIGGTLNVSNSALTLASSPTLPGPHTIFMLPSTRIEVEDGSLSLLDANIYSCEDWQGIVSNHSSITIEKSTIRNAEAGVLLKNFSNSSISKSLFENNSINIGIFNCNDSSNKLISHCNLKSLVERVNTNNLDIDSLRNTTTSMIYIDSSAHVELMGNSFDQRDSNTLSQVNFITAIEARSSSIYVDSNSVFDNFKYGFHLIECFNSYLHRSRVGSSFINLSKSPILYLPVLPFTENGLYLKNCSNIDINIGTIKDCLNGINFFADNSFTASTINKFTFENNKFSIIIAPDVNPWINVNPGLNISTNQINIEIKCNNFLQTEYAISGSGKLLNQGNGLQGVSNDFDLIKNPFLDWAVVWKSNVSPFFDYYWNSSIFDPELGTRNNCILDNQIISTSEYLSKSATTNLCNSGSFLKYKREIIHDSSITSKTPIVFPNPSSGKYIIKSNLGINQIEIFDIIGNKIFIVEKINEQKYEFDISNFSNGVYTILIRNQNNEIFFHKILKN